MRRLFLVRHAKAELSGGRDDYARKLTERGRADARRVATTLAARRFLPELLIHSGAARAKETAEIFAAEWRSKTAVEKDTQLYEASLATLLDRTRALRQEHQRVGLVRAQPRVWRTGGGACRLWGQADLPRLAVKYPTGAVAVLDFSIDQWAEVEPNSGMLALYLTPAELEPARTDAGGPEAPSPPALSAPTLHCPNRRAPPK